MTKKAFAPGHITGFFEICDGPSDPLRKGSRGAGVNLSLGVLTTVEASEAGKQSVDIRLNGRKAPAETTLAAVLEIIEKRKLQVSVRSEVQLPVGQGLGMSAAGALSTALALSSALGLPHTLHRAGLAAHIAEVQTRTGLGDVSGQMRGGWEIRVRPGFPPYGFVDRMLAPKMRMAICVSGEPVATKRVLGDPAMRRSINRAGRACMNEMLEKPALENFFSLSCRFARQTGLASKETLLLVDEIMTRNLGQAGVSMIGNSVFAVGDIAGLRNLMKGHGKVYLCETDLSGATPVV